MKNLRFLFFLASFFYSNFSFTQVDDIGIAISYEEAYVDEINDNGMLVISYLDKGKEIHTHAFSIDPMLPKKENLRIGSMISFSGEEFIETDKKIIKAVKLKSGFSGKKKITFTGRIEEINGNTAIIDGNKVVLKSKGKIKGDSRGYGNKKFSTVNDLKLGAWATVEGQRKNGVTHAQEIIVFPRIVDNEEKHKKEMGLEKLEKVYNEVFFPIWNNKEERKQLLGKEAFGFVITENEAVQSFVSRVGMKLVPDYMKGKLNFSFVVVDDPSWNASMTGMGLCFVHMGLLMDVENEAQLAAVLGHEITHAVYKHSVQEKIKEEELLKKKQKRAKRNEKWKKVKFGSIVKKIDKKGRVEKAEKVTKQAEVGVEVVLGEGSTYKRKKQDNNLLDVLANIKDFKATKSFFDYNQEQELQSDRVGLYYLVNAGYDPQEATKIWKKQYQKGHNHNTDEAHEDKPLVGNMVAVLSGDTSIKEVHKNSLEAKSKESFRTHPDNLKRFKGLNALISFYWSRDMDAPALDKGIEFK